MWTRNLVAALWLTVAAHGMIPHEDPGLLFRAGDKNGDGVMDATELEEFYVHRADAMNGKTIADIAGGAKKATMQMDSNKDGGRPHCPCLTQPVSPSRRWDPLITVPACCRQGVCQRVLDPHESEVP